MPTTTEAPRLAADTPRESRGIQSIEVGGQLLLALVHLGRPCALKELAREAGMNAAKAHPYLVSFGKLGLIQQQAGTGYYGLGPLALQLGLIGLQQVDPVGLASEVIPALAQEIGQTVGVAIWGNRGPTFVRLAEGPEAVHVNMRHGTVVTVKGTASGRLFAAFMPKEDVLAALAAETGEAPKQRLDARFEAELRRIREQRFSAIVDGTVQGIGAMAAPVFDGFGKMVVALTAIGPSASLDVDPGSKAAQALVRAARGISARMGARA